MKALINQLIPSRIRMEEEINKGFNRTEKQLSEREPNKQLIQKENQKNQRKMTIKLRKLLVVSSRKPKNYTRKPSVLFKTTCKNLYTLFKTMRINKLLIQDEKVLEDLCNKLLIQNNKVNLLKLPGIISNKNLKEIFITSLIVKLHSQE